MNKTSTTLYIAFASRPVSHIDIGSSTPRSTHSSKEQAQTLVSQSPLLTSASKQIRVACIAVRT
uniref:Uncharacterized protein n=1 Tax=Arundo donax TaxID=35708 RepID=A0A0A9FDS6_ARUDO